MILSPDSAVAVVIVPSAVALFGYLITVLCSRYAGGWFLAILVVAWTAHALAIAFDMFGVGTVLLGVRFGFAQSLSATVWLVLAVHVVESRLVPLPRVRRALAILGAIAVAVAWYFPGESFPHAIPLWAPLHWVLGIVSYGLFGVALLHAALLTGAERRMRMKRLSTSSDMLGLAGLPLLQLEKLTFRFVIAGFVALSVTLLLGWSFATPWRWDHKTVFSMLSWLVFAGLLAGRRAFGWRGRRAMAWLYAGTVLLLLAYAGSRFVLEVVLQRAPTL